MIEKIVIRNFRKYRDFTLAVSDGTNLIVGDNDTGKSTLIEAVHLALTGRLNGRLLSQELSPYHFNQAATAEWVSSLSEKPELPPELIIELYLKCTDETAPLKGTNNLLSENTCGVRIQATLSPDFLDEYERFVAEPSGIKLVPTEYYRVDWLGFCGTGITARSVPASATVIDSTSIRLQSGIDHQLQQIINSHLDPSERVELSRQYRSLREQFGERESVKAINDKLRADEASFTSRDFSLSIDISQRYTWESSLAAHIDNLPFQYIGKGEQNALKTLLALGRKVDGVQIVLIEEPETHLSFSSLRCLIKRIEDACADKQLIIATHSTFVLNKLGLDNLVLLGNGDPLRLADLPKGTVSYFKRLSGYDTLRFILAKKVVLVEGPSDELVVQRAYQDAKGKLPIEDGIDVISVGLSHKRFLDLAVKLKRRTWVVTDNDGKPYADVESRFASYLTHDFITLHTCKDPEQKTLEPTLVGCNTLDDLNTVLDTAYATKEEAVADMTANKTERALAIFESTNTLTMPDYIGEVVK
jgi:predicted ATP-dependent endonuclease of OLD family